MEAHTLSGLGDPHHLLGEPAQALAHFRATLVLIDRTTGHHALRTAVSESLAAVLHDPARTAETPHVLA